MLQTDPPFEELNPAKIPVTEVKTSPKIKALDRPIQSAKRPKANVPKMMATWCKISIQVLIH